MKDNIGGTSGGGAATFGGTNYQARVSGWLLARMLAERPVFPVGPKGHGQYVRFETSEPTDDILVGTVEGGHSFVQAKRTISLSSSPQSEFASVVSQFVRQFLRSTSSQLVRPWSHKLEASRDRLVLVTTSDSPDTIRLNLLQLLERLKGLVEGQPLTDAATNQGQHEALQIISDHIMRIWREEVGQEPTESDLRAILKLISVVILDVEPEGSDRREILNLIALGVAAQPTQDAAVWSILESQAADLSQKRSGADIAKIREILQGSGISLRAAPSYEPDIQRLREYSAASLSYAAHNSEIPINGGVLKINRDVAVALRTLSEKHSLVIVGVPGSGKTGVLHDFADDLLAHGRDVIFLSVDHVTGKSLGELRNEMGLSHDLVSIISNWTGNQTGFLIIDSLDAQRGDPASDALLTLIQQVIDRKSRWRVIASIRKYDLRYNPELQNLFRGNLGDDCPSNFCDTEYRHLRHINVPVLSEGELAQLTKAAPPLAALVQSASPNLHELLRVPFNLKLAADIIASGTAISEFQPITTQTELLERYWANRVGGAVAGALREQVLRKICEQMLRDRRLRTERKTVAVPETAQALEHLLSGHVLEEWQPATSAIPLRQIISFSHHIIFDFAVSQLYLKHDRAELVGQLASDPDVFVMARPSILTRYDQLWRNDRPTFWRLLFTVCLEEHIPQFGKLIGADVIVNNSRALADLSPLIDGLNSTDDATNKAAHITFRLLVGALSAGPRDALVGPTAGPFCELLDVVTEHPRPESVGYMQTLLKTTLESPALLTPYQTRLAGNAARRILEFAWRQTRRNSWTITNAIRSVCITFGGNPAESGALLRQCIQLDHLQKYGYEEMSCLARYVNELIQYDAQLTSDIYAAAFAWEETSTETTEMGAGRILVLTSDRRQDYKHAQWQLAQEFPHFVRFSPLEATTAVCAVMDAYCAREHRSVSSEPVPDVFELGGTRATVIADYSYIWDESFSSKDDDEITILDAFFRDLEQRIQNPAETAITSAIWNAFVRCAKQAVIWRHLLELGTKYPAEFGLKIKELAWATPILRGMDTEGAAAEFVGAIFPLLATAERRKVEEAIASLALSTANDEAAREDQRQLLNRISYSDLVTSEAKVLADTLGSKDSVTPVPRPRRRIEAGAFAMPDDAFYKDFLGVSTTDPSNKKVLDLLKPIQTFQALHLNNPPSQTEAEAILPQVQQLISDLHTNRDSVDPKLIASSNGLIAATCAVFARMTSLSCDTALVLLR